MTKEKTEAREDGLLNGPPKIHFIYTDGEAGIIVQVNRDDLTDEKKIRLDEICERATAEINTMMNGNA